MGSPGFFFQEVKGEHEDVLLPSDLTYEFLSVVGLIPKVIVVASQCVSVVQ